MIDVKKSEYNSCHKGIIFNISFSFPCGDFKTEKHCVTLTSSILPLIMVAQCPSSLFTFPNYLPVGRC